MINHSRTRLLGLLCTCLSFCLLPVRAQGIADNSNSVIVEAQTEVICKSMTQSVEAGNPHCHHSEQEGTGCGTFLL